MKPSPARFDHWICQIFGNIILDFCIAKYLRVGVIQNTVDGTTVVKMDWVGFHMEANFKIFIYILVWEHETKYQVRKSKTYCSMGHMPPPQ